MKQCYSLPNWVVSSNITDTFKARLQKCGHKQNIVYDFRVQLQGIGTHSGSLYLLLRPKSETLVSDQSLKVICNGFSQN